MRSPALACALQVVSGVGMVIVDVLAITSLQRDLPGDVLSRVLGVFDTLVLGGILLASLATGILLAHADVNVALIAVGVGIPAIALVGLPTLLRADRTSAAVAERLRPRVELLSELDLLAGADRNTLERLAAAAEEVVLPAGRDRDPRGRRARRAVDPGARRAVGLQPAGDGAAARELPPVTAPGYVGELGLLHGIPRTATVRTGKESTLLRIDGQEFLSALQASRPSPSLLSVAGTRMARTQAPGAAANPREESQITALRRPRLAAPKRAERSVSHKLPARRGHDHRCAIRGCEARGQSNPERACLPCLRAAPDRRTAGGARPPPECLGCLR